MLRAQIVLRVIAEEMSSGALPGMGVVHDLKVGPGAGRQLGEGEKPHDSR